MISPKLVIGDVLVTGDWHLDDQPLNEYRHQFQKHLRKLVRQHKPAMVVVLGDLTEAKDRHPARLVNRVVGHFARLAELCPVTVLRGNHDYADANNPFWAFLARIPGVTWVNAPTGGKNAPTGLSEALGRCLLLPHTANPARDWEKLDFGAFRWIFAHQTFEGAVGDNGHQLTGGVPQSVFPKGARVISGDIHTPQKIGVVTYVGAPYTVDFGDSYKPRILLLSSGDQQITSIPCIGPQKRLVEVEHGMDISKDEIRLSPGDIVKVRVHTDNLEHWAETKEQIYAWGDGFGLVIHAIQPVVAGQGKVERRAAAVRTDDDYFSVYAKNKGLSESVVKTGKLLMRKA